MGGTRTKRYESFITHVLMGRVDKEAIDEWGRWHVVAAATTHKALKQFIETHFRHPKKDIVLWLGEWTLIDGLQPRRRPGAELKPMDLMRDLGYERYFVELTEELEGLIRELTTSNKQTVSNLKPFLEDLKIYERKIRQKFAKAKRQPGNHPDTA